MADLPILSPLVPPQAPPADLVIDVFGTFLGKRSGRMIVRWREPDRVDPGPDPFGPNNPPPSPADASTAPTSHATDSPAAPNNIAHAAARNPGAARAPALLKFPGPLRSEPASGETPLPSTTHDEVPGAAHPSAPTNDDAGDAPNDPSRELTEPTDVSRDSTPNAVAARLLSLWSRGRTTSRPKSRTTSKSASRASNHSSPRGAGPHENGPHDGDADPSAEPEDRFRRLDSALHELDAKFDDTPGTQWRHREVPLDRLKSVVIASRGVTVSTDLVEALVERGVALSFLSSRGVPVAHLTAPALAATVQTRRSQLAAYSTRAGVELAAAFIDGKVRNQRHTILYFGKYLKAAAPDRYQLVFEKAKSLHAMRRQLRDIAGASPRRAVEGPLIDVLRDRLMGFEGAAARCYWEAVAAILAGRVDFPGRMTRGAVDPVNSALNYGYGILYSQVFGAVVNAGLEPYAGFLHVDRPGKPSLVLDLVEEFRAPIVDRAVLAIVNQGIALETDEHGLSAGTRRIVADRVLERLNKPVPFEGKRHRLRSILQMQARHLATAVRGERVYKPFCSRW